MALEIVIRFIVGGVVVSAFAVIGDVLRPKSFAGIFGAAPSVALATLGLTFLTKPLSDVSLEGRSMLIGAAALCAYSLLVSWLMSKQRTGAMMSATASWAAWFAVAFVLWGVLLR
jgi:hypothetical protein